MVKVYIKFSCITASLALIIGCFAALCFQDSAFGLPRDVTRATPTGLFLTAMTNVFVGNSGWSQDFVLDGLERHFCEQLPLHKGMILDVLKVEIRTEKSGKQCWSVLDDRAGYLIRRDKHGMPIHYSSTERTATSESSQ